MKRSILALLLSVLIACAASAQHCPQASVAIPTQVGTVPGLAPLPWDLPCMVAGTQVDDTIYFHNFDTVYIGSTMILIDSLKLDSIGNLPDGLCWVSNKASNTFQRGEDGIIYVHGFCTAAPGQYKMKILFEAGTNIGQLPYGSDAEAYASLRYYVRVRCAGASCTPLDTVTGRSTAFIPYATCPGPPPAVITAGSTSFCPGSSTVLHASRATGYTYRWSTGATIDSVTVSAAGSYTVTVYNGPDSTVSAPKVITLLTPPSGLVYPSGPVTLCPGDTLPLSSTDAGTGYTYLWSNSLTTQVISVTAAGAYRVTVTDANGCTAVSAYDTVTTGTNPVALIIRNGFTLTAGTGTGYLYQWYLDDSILTGQTSQSITATTNGDYSVYVINPQGCHATSPATSVLNVGINDIRSTVALSLHPNPTDGRITLDATGHIGDSYEIHSAIGSSISRQAITAEHSLIDMSAQPSGIYYITVRHGAAAETLRFTLIR